MKNMRAIAILIFLLLKMDLIAQSNSESKLDTTMLSKIKLQWLNNYSIRFDIGLANHMSKYQIGVILENDSDYLLLKRIGNEQWLSLLNDCRYDWASNLCLYSTSVPLKSGRY